MYFDMGRGPKIGVPKIIPNLDNLCIETHGFGVAPF